MSSGLSLGKWFVTCIIIFLTREPLCSSWKRLNCSYTPLTFVTLFERLTAYSGSQFSDIMYFVILSPRITNSNSFEVLFSFRCSNRRSCDCSWRSITCPFSPTWYHLFSVSVPSTSFQSSSTDCSIFFSNSICSFIFYWFLAISSSTVLISFEIIQLPSR